MRRLVAVPLCAATVAIASIAGADPTPTFSTLPEGKIAPPPRKLDLPAHVTAHDRVDGINVAQPSKEESRQMESSGYRQVSVFTTEKRARDATQGRFNNSEEDEGDACLLQHQDMGFDGGDEGWSPFFSSQTQVSASRPNAAMRKQGATAQGGVDSVRFERLVTTGSPRLEGASALVDPDTGGVKLLARESMPLALIAKGPVGINVYAARDGQKIHFVVTNPAIPDALPKQAMSFARSLTRRLSAQLSSTMFRNGHSDCGHFRATMQPEKGSGEVVTVQAMTVSPGEPEPAEEGAPPDVQAVRAMKKRPVLVNLSVSQSASDKEPVISVSFNWVGKESDQPF